MYAALKPEHEWVCWRDIDVVENPPDIIEEFMQHDKDILVPSTLNQSSLYSSNVANADRHMVPLVR